MSTTTTLRVPEDLKARVARLARRTGKSTHALMVEAIEETVELAEARLSMVEEAQDRFAKLMESGRGIDWHEMRSWLKERASGRKAPAPRARAWRE